MPGRAYALRATQAISRDYRATTNSCRVGLT
jgi:hypothetical protein